MYFRTPLTTRNITTLSDLWCSVELKSEEHTGHSTVPLVLHFDGYLYFRKKLLQGSAAVVNTNFGSSHKVQKMCKKVVHFLV